MSENHFLQLTRQEVLPRLNQSDKKIAIKLWKDIDHFYSCSISASDNESITVDALDVLPHQENTYFVCFSFRNMNYYAKCIVSEQNKLLLNEDIYRSERRRDIRIVMYPRFNAYLYFTFDQRESIEDDNVLSFNKNKNKEDKLLKDYKREIATSPEINGERILDISNNGLAIICSASSYELLNTVKPESAVLVFNGERVEVSGIHLMYEVDYIDLRFESIKMKKVGLKINENEKVKEIVSRYDDQSLTLSSLDKEFQIYIETE